MEESSRYVRVDFRRFKAFESFTLHLRAFNILAGPNNSGKSTVLAAFRILAAGMRRAQAKRSQIVPTPNGRGTGYPVELGTISVAEENLFFNYDDSEPASVRFVLSNRNELTLYFPEQGSCYLLPDAQGRRVDSPSTFRSAFNSNIGFVPILGPVEHNEPLFEKDAARRALFSYRAARNFRNIWYHFPERFDEFRGVLKETWPGMDIERPTVDFSHGKPRLHMFCPEERIPRELFWAGFGFQVWCQMLTHLIQSREVSLFLIDEPDIYLHSDLQRQLLGLLRNLGPDILVATHSTEIISEAEADDIVLINKRRRSAKRIKDPSQLGAVFSALGSNLNPTLTQLAKTRRAVFVEGKDFQIFSRFARKLEFGSVANRSEFAVVAIEGFNPERVKDIRIGMETTLGVSILAALVLDRDYRSEVELAEIEGACAEFAEVVEIHRCKEVENFLLIPEAIDRAVARRLDDSNRRSGKQVRYEPCAEQVLAEFAARRRSHVMAQYLACRRRFERLKSPTEAEESVNERTLTEFEELWKRPFEVIPGKEALAAVNAHLQATFGVSITTTALVDAMSREEIPESLQALLGRLAEFARLPHT